MQESYSGNGGVTKKVTPPFCLFMSRVLAVPTSKPMNETAEKLIELLHSLAMYNDKGAIWRRDSSAEIEAMRASYRAPLDALIAQIGAENFPPELLRELRGDAVLRDDSGFFAERVEAHFAAKK